MPKVSAPSAGRLLQFLRDGRARTRRDLMDLTGLSRSAVAERVDRLVRHGYVREEGVDASTGGRRPAVLRIDEGSAVVLAADLGAVRARVAVVDLLGRILAETSGRPDEPVGWAVGRLHALLAAEGRSVTEVRGVGVGLAGPVDARTPVPPAFAAGFPAPILLDNDANVMALGEYTVAGPEARPVLLVRAGAGIGAGIVENGRVLRGTAGAAGEISHVRLRGYDDVRCACGLHGCLTAVASGRALAARLADTEPAVRDTVDVVRLARAGHPAATRLVSEAGRALGEVLATVVSVVDPGTLLISGALARTGEHLIGAVREAVYQRHPARGLRVAEGRLGPRAGVAGAAALVLDHVLSPDSVDAHLSGS